MHRTHEYLEMRLKDIGNIPFGIGTLASVYPANKAIVAKADRLSQNGKIIRLKRGMYVVNPEISEKRINEFLIANHLYGPSYVSKQSALRYYGLIPERVYEITSLTTGLAKNFVNKIANFSYTHCSPEYFRVGITNKEEEGVSFLFATPEKALCDLMIFTPKLNLRYLKELHLYLEEDLRLDMSALTTFNLQLLEEIRDKGKKKDMISLLIKFISDGKFV